MGLGPSPSYLCKFNDYVLPGYVQYENMESGMNIAGHTGPFVDGSMSEETGLLNKPLTVGLKVWEKDYLTCKDQVELAVTMLRSTRAGFAPLYLQYTDKRYSALVRNVRMSKQAGTSVRTLDYEVEFELKPWLESVEQKSIVGTGLITTDQVARTINDGGWTPALVQLYGTDMEITGALPTGEPTGHIKMTGSTGSPYMLVDTEQFTCMINGVNANNQMETLDYRLYIGPGQTLFNVTGGTVEINWRDRWYM